MDIEALESAEAALRRAQIAQQELEKLTTGWSGLPQHFPEVAAKWSDLLVYGNRVFTKLEQACKNGPSKGWFDNVKAFRRRDPLLAYVLHARNSDEHRPMSIATHEAIVTAYKFPAGTDMDAMVQEEGPARDRGADLKEMNALYARWGGTPIGESKERQLRLRPVHDRGSRYEVPTEHRDQALPNSSVNAIAQLFVIYLEGLCKEARGHVGV